MVLMDKEARRKGAISIYVAKTTSHVWHISLTVMAEKNNYKTLFISHGGGPLPLLGDAGHIEMVENLKKLSAEIFRPSAEERSWNESFEEWLIDTCSNKEYDASMRTERLLHWQKAPHARFCHPREEHLLPLHVCYGINMSRCNDYHQLNILGKRASVYCW